MITQLHGQFLFSGSRKAQGATIYRRSAGMTVILRSMMRVSAKSRLQLSLINTGWTGAQHNQSIDCILIDLAYRNHYFIQFHLFK